jgi:N-acetylneuraminic acid mutarotase
MKKGSASQSALISLRGSIALLVCGAAACSMLSGALLAFFRPEVPSKSLHRTLTFEQRVAYQRAIEEVYWCHRIWPKERPDLKPALDAVMSHAQLEKRVADYLRNSQALEDYWQRPITAEQLQAEMDRMAQNTKQPEVLHELFEALGNDPFVIAECLARPALAERTLATVASVKEPSRGGAEMQDPAAIRAMSANYKLPQVCTDDTWTPTSTINAPSQRGDHTAVWTGSEMIVWGGATDVSVWNTGGRYNPATDSWTATSTASAPTARYGHKAVWTGSEMIVWGGFAGGNVLNTGGRYNPVSDSWTATSVVSAPEGRESFTAVWTGSDMIVWGGYNGSSELNTGGRYNPTTDTWTPTNITNAPTGREEHTAIWTGSEMIVWGGFFFDGNSHWWNTGSRYTPGTDSWISTSVTNPPTGRRRHTAIWTGSQMVVWGGYDGNSDVNTGGRYDPSTDSWTATNTTNAPSGRDLHTEVWTGAEMIVWGGCGFCNSGNAGRHADPDAPAVTPTPSQPPPTPTLTPSHGTGGRYNPSTDNWRATSTSPDAPAPRDGHTAVWSGNEMIVWGGYNGTSGFLNTGGRYCAQSSATPTSTPTATATATPTPCTGRCSPTPRPRPTPAPRP